MRRPVRNPESSAPGQDSFLDILANIVGILIILVMFVGVRARNAPVEVEGPDEATQAAMAGLERDAAHLASLEGDARKLAVQLAEVQRETLLRNQERVALATAIAAAEHELKDRREKLSAEARKDFDLRRALAESQAELERLKRETEEAQSSDAGPIVVQSLPTPLSRTVDGSEAHFLLRDGRIAFVPMQKLIEEFKADARAKADALERLPEITETIGPIRGFRVKYTLVRKKISLEVRRHGGVMGTVAALDHLEVLPVNPGGGETVEEALAHSSAFRAALKLFPANRSTVTIWTYPDSFEQFRRLKKELFHWGYGTAGRPLPSGQPISASPEGSKSAAE